MGAGPERRQIPLDSLSQNLRRDDITQDLSPEHIISPSSYKLFSLKDLKYRMSTPRKERCIPPQFEEERDATDADGMILEVVREIDDIDHSSFFVERFRDKHQTGLIDEVVREMDADKDSSTESCEAEYRKSSTVVKDEKTSDGPCEAESRKSSTVDREKKSSAGSCEAENRKSSLIRDKETSARSCGPTVSSLVLHRGAKWSKEELRKFMEDKKEKLPVSKV